MVRGWAWKKLRWPVLISGLLATPASNRYIPRLPTRPGDYLRIPAAVAASACAFTAIGNYAGTLAPTDASLATAGLISAFGHFLLHIAKSIITSLNANGVALASLLLRVGLFLFFPL